jgi:transcriptional/translational regulatory protein YebC/TACO1
MIEGITDNKNRTLGELKLIINQRGGKSVNEGGIKWMFEKKGVVSIDATNKNKEDMELTAIEAGAEDIEWQEDTLYIYVKSEELEKTRKALEEKGLKILSSNLEWVPNEPLEVDDATRERFQNFFEALDEHDDVQNVYTNI